MLKNILKKNLLNSTIILIILFLDRVSKNYILKIAELENAVDIYLTPYLNLYLIWNKGIAFGILPFNESFMYNVISFIIAIITLVILFMIVKNNGFRKYALISIFSGAISNLYDRIYYSGVPDFIDFHIDNFHWFIFNVADIFITLGVICLIYAEIFLNKGNNKRHV